MYRRRVLAAKAQDVLLEPDVFRGDKAAVLDTRSGYKVSDRSNKTYEQKQQRRMVHQLHLCMARSGEKALTASASALSRRMDYLSKMDNASKLRCRRSEDCHYRSQSLETPSWCAYLPNWARWIGHFVCSILLRTIMQLLSAANAVGEAIGQSPRQMRRTRLQEESDDEEGEGLEDTADDALELCWALNALLACLALCLLAVVMAFLGQWQAAPEACDADDEVEVGRSDFDGLKLARLLLRIAVVASVSFTSGMGLRVIHPVQSALLCGF